MSEPKHISQLIDEWKNWIHLDIVSDTPVDPRADTASISVQPSKMNSYVMIPFYLLEKGAGGNRLAFIRSTKPYTDDFRIAAVAYFNTFYGYYSQREIARYLEVPRTTLQSWIQKQNSTL